MPQARPRENPILSAQATAACLPWPALVREIGAVARDPAVRVPERIVMPTASDAVLFVMPATDGRVAMTKLITLTPANAGSPRAVIQGDVVVFDVASGARRLVLDGPTITGRRTAAVSALAAQLLAPVPQGPMLIVGAGVQARAHLEVFAQVLGVREFRIASRRRSSAEALAAHARSLGLHAQAVDDADTALAACPLVAICTPARAVVLRAMPRDDAFVAAVGAYTPDMQELDAPVCRALAGRGALVLDARDAEQEAGDLIRAGIAVAGLPVLTQYARGELARPARGPVLFNNCGWGGWDLAAARLVLAGAG